MFGVIISSPVHEITIARDELHPDRFVIVVTMDGLPLPIPPVYITFEELEILLRVAKNEV